MIRSLVQKGCSLRKPITTCFSTLSDVKVVINEDNAVSSKESNLFPLLGSTTVFDSKEHPLRYPSVTTLFNELSNDIINNGELSHLFEKHVLEYFLGEGLYKSIASRLTFIPTSGMIMSHYLASNLIASCGLFSRVFMPYPFSPQFQRILRIHRIKSNDYRYVDYRTGRLNFGGMLEDFYLCPNHSCFVLNVPGCSPTGLCLCDTEWNEILNCCAEHHHLMWFDASYLGLRSGNGYIDFAPIRECIKMNIDCIVSLDLESSLMIPGMGVSSLLIVNGEEGNANHFVDISGLFDKASIGGMNLCSSFFSNPQRTQQWENECLSEVNRYASIRESLKKGKNEDIKALDFLLTQNGPFSLLPFSQKTLERKGLDAILRSDGFINLSSLTATTLPLFREVLQTLCSKFPFC